MANENTRSLTLDRSGIDVEARTVPVSVSSDSNDVLRNTRGKGVGYQVLDHSSMASIDLSRFKGPNGGPLLWSHDTSVIIGRFIPTGVSGGKLQGVARFGKSEKASEVFQDIQDGIVTDTSSNFDYDPADVVTEASNRDYPVHRIKHWTLTEASMVSVPADDRVGVMRSEEPAPVLDTPPDPNAVMTMTEDPAPRACKREDCLDPNCSNDSLCENCRCSSEPRSNAPEKAPEALAANGRSRKESVMDPILEGAAPVAALDLSTAFTLRSIADAHGKGREAQEILTSGKPEAEVRKLVLDLIATTPVAQSLEDMGASRAEQKQFSYARLLSASADQAEGIRGKGCFEMEVSQTVAKSMPANYQQRGGVFVPFAISNSRALDTATATGAKEMVFTTPGELIEALRNSLKVAGLGAKYLTGLSGPVGFVKQTGISTASWVAEASGTDVAESNLTTGIVVLTPRTLQGTSSFSRQLLVEASYPVESMVRFDLGFAHAAAIDLAAIHGTGGTQPTGLYNLTGVLSQAIGGAATYAHQDGWSGRRQERSAPESWFHHHDFRCRQHANHPGIPLRFRVQEAVGRQHRSRSGVRLQRCLQQPGFQHSGRRSWWRNRVRSDLRCLVSGHRGFLRRRI